MEYQNYFGIRVTHEEIAKRLGILHEERFKDNTRLIDGDGFPVGWIDGKKLRLDKAELVKKMSEMPEIATPLT